MADIFLIDTEVAKREVEAFEKSIDTIQRSLDNFNRNTSFKQLEKELKKLGNTTNEEFGLLVNQVETSLQRLNDATSRKTNTLAWAKESKSARESLAADIKQITNIMREATKDIDGYEKKRTETMQEQARIRVKAAMQEAVETKAVYTALEFKTGVTGKDAAGKDVLGRVITNITPKNYDQYLVEAKTQEAAIAKSIVRHAKAVAEKERIGAKELAATVAAEEKRLQVERTFGNAVLKDKITRQEQEIALERYGLAHILKLRTQMVEQTAAANKALEVSSEKRLQVERTFGNAQEAAIAKSIARHAKAETERIKREARELADIIKARESVLQVERVFDTAQESMAAKRLAVEMKNSAARLAAEDASAARHKASLLRQLSEANTLNEVRAAQQEKQLWIDRVFAKAQEDVIRATQKEQQKLADTHVNNLRRQITQQTAVADKVTASGGKGITVFDPFSMSGAGGTNSSDAVATSHSRIAAAVRDSNKAMKEGVAPAGGLSDALRKLHVDGNDLHSGMRGLASGFNLLWLTWGNLAPLMVGALASFTMVKSYKDSAEFEHTLWSITELAGTSVKEISSLNNVIFDMARVTKYGPLETVKAIETLTLAGLSAKEAIAALKPTLNFASAGGVTADQAAATLVAVGTAYNYTAKAYSTVGDMIAKSAAESMTSVADMSESFKTASVVAQQYNVSLADTSIGLMALAQIGISGQAAGTSYRNFYTYLTSDTPKVTGALKTLGVSLRDSEGNLKSYLKINEEISIGLQRFGRKEQGSLLSAISNERGNKSSAAMQAQMRAEVEKTTGTLTTHAEKVAAVASAYKNLEERTKAQVDSAAGFTFMAAMEENLTRASQGKGLGASLEASLIKAFEHSESAFTIMMSTIREGLNSSEFTSALSSIVRGFADLGMWVIDTTKFLYEHRTAVMVVAGVYATWLALGSKLGTLATGLLYVSTTTSAVAASSAVAATMTTAAAGAMGAMGVTSATAAVSTVGAAAGITSAGAASVVAAAEIGTVTSAFNALTVSAAGSGTVISGVMAGITPLGWAAGIAAVTVAVGYGITELVEYIGKINGVEQALSRAQKTALKGVEDMYNEKARAEGLNNRSAAEQIDERRRLLKEEEEMLANGATRAQINEKQLGDRYLARINAEYDAKLLAYAAHETSRTGTLRGEIKTRRELLAQEDIAAINQSRETALSEAKVRLAYLGVDERNKAERDRKEAEKKSKLGAGTDNLPPRPERASASSLGNLQAQYSAEETSAKEHYANLNKMADAQHSAEKMSNGAYYLKKLQLAEDEETAELHIYSRAYDALRDKQARELSLAGKSATARKKINEAFESESAKLLEKESRLAEKREVRENDIILAAETRANKLIRSTEVEIASLQRKEEAESRLEELRKDAEKRGPVAVARLEAEIKAIEKYDGVISKLAAEAANATAVLSAFDEVVEPSDATRVAYEAQLAVVKKLVEELAKLGLAKSDAANTAANTAEARVNNNRYEKEQRKLAEDYEKLAKDVGDQLFDSLTGKGKDAAAKLREYLKSALLQPLKIILQPILGSIGNTIAGILMPSGARAATDAFGSLAGGAGGSAATSLLGTSLASAFSGVTSMVSTFGTAALASIQTMVGMTGTVAQGAAAAAAAASPVTSMLGTLAGPAAVVIGIAAAFGAFGGTDTVGKGLRGTLGAGDIKKYDLDREDGAVFFGAEYATKDRGLFELSRQIQSSFEGLRSKALLMAESLGLGTAELKNFTTTLGTDLIHPDTGGYGVDLTGLNAEQAQAKVEAALVSASNTLAEQILGSWTRVDEQVSTVIQKSQGWWDDAVTGTETVVTHTQKLVYVASEYAKYGEKAIDTLTRLATSLATANEMFSLLGYTTVGTGLQAADTASKIADAFGGLDVFSSTLKSYYDNFYLEEEKKLEAARRISTAMSALGVVVSSDQVLNATKAQYRLVVEAVEQQYGKNSPQFVAITKFSSIFAEFHKEADAAATSLSDMLSVFKTNFFTVAERKAEASNTISTRLTAAGLSVSSSDVDKATREQYRAYTDVVERLYGKDSLQYKTLLELSPLFAEFHQAVEDTATSIEDLLKTYKSNYLTPVERSAEASNTISTRLSGVGLSVSSSEVDKATREGYRAYTEAVERVYGKNSPQYRAVLELSSLFAEFHDNVASVTADFSSFNTSMLSDVERNNNLIYDTRSAIEALGLVMPTTRDEFVNLINSQIALGDSGRKNVTALLGMTSALDMLLPKFGDFEAQVASLSLKLTSGLVLTGNPVTDALKLAEYAGKQAVLAGQVATRRTEIAAQESVDRAKEAADAAKAIEDEQQNAIKGLRTEQTNLEISLLRAQGKEAEALAKSVETYSVANKAAYISQYNYNEGLKEQVRIQESVNALKENTNTLNISLLEAQGRTNEAYAAQTVKLSSAEKSVSNYNRSIQTQIDMIANINSSMKAYLTGSQYLHQQYGSMAIRLQQGGFAQSIEELIQILAGADKDALLRFFMTIKDTAPEAAAAVAAISSEFAALKESQMAEVIALRGRATQNYIEAQNKVTEAQKAVANVLQSTLQGFHSYLDELNNSTVGIKGTDSLVSSRDKFEKLAQKAMQGDTSVLPLLQPAAKNFLDLSKSFSSSVVDYRTDLAGVKIVFSKMEQLGKAALDKLPAVAVTSTDAVGTAYLDLAKAIEAELVAKRAALAMQAPLADATKDLVTQYREAVALTPGWEAAIGMLNAGLALPYEDILRETLQGYIPNMGPDFYASRIFPLRVDAAIPEMGDDFSVSTMANRLLTLRIPGMGDTFSLSDVATTTLAQSFAIRVPGMGATFSLSDVATTTLAQSFAIRVPGMGATFSLSDVATTTLAQSFAIRVPGMGASFNLADMANAAISSAVARMVANTPAPRPTPAPAAPAEVQSGTYQQLLTRLGGIGQVANPGDLSDEWWKRAITTTTTLGLGSPDLARALQAGATGSFLTSSTTASVQGLASYLHLPAFASGGSHEGGWALVGEEGPELANIGASRIYNARDTQQMFGGGNEELIVELRRLNERIVELEQSMKASLYPIARNTKDTSEKIVKWDGDGMPAVRT